MFVCVCGLLWSVTWPSAPGLFWFSTCGTSGSQWKNEKQGG